MKEERIVIQLRLPRFRYAIPGAVLATLGVFLGWVSTWTNLENPNGAAKARAIGRLLMSIDRIGSFWPIPAALSISFLAGAGFLVWALIARRPFELRIDSSKLSWPSLAPWREPYALPLGEIESVESNPARDHLVLNTTGGRRLIPAWWIPEGTSLEKVVTMVSARLRVVGDDGQPGHLRR